MKTQITRLFIIWALTLFSGFIFVADATDTRITIVHTNDIHGNFAPQAIRSKEPGQPDRLLGGFVALQAYVSEIRAKNVPVLLLDAGDFMTGNPICDIEFQGVRGGVLVEFFNIIGYDGQTLGNHEFDISLDHARELINLAQYPVFSANLFTTDGRYITDQPYHIYQKGGIRVGVIGVIVDDLPEYINAPQKNQVKLRPAALVVDSLAMVLDDETDLIVVLSHSSIEMDRKIAKHVGDKIDVIVGGHSHTRMKEAENVNGVLIVQAGAQLANLGVLHLTVENDRITDHDYQLTPLWNEDITPDKKLEKMVQHYQEEIDREYGKVIGELKKPWRRSHFHESNVGNYISDVIRTHSGADIAGINSGGIRINLDTGPIKKLDIKNLLPFGNTIVVFEATGEEILKFIRLNARSSVHQLSGILQLSGLSYECLKTKDNKLEVIQALINKKQIEADKTYRFATVDFVVANWEKYLGFEPRQVTDTQTTLSELVMHSIEEQNIVSSKVEGRMLIKRK
ncbi:MAG TPA: bifunctional metallophosphatase/5'-nucleotidase [bacterium]|nr:bifunctional metallophosphatase/5'-nucleotidase [bacterium]